MDKKSTAEVPSLCYQLHGNCYLNITWHCTLRCAFCPKFNGCWEVQQYDLRLYQEPSAAEVLAAIGDIESYNEFVFCGLGEPTLRLDVLLEVAEALKAQGAYIRINTDGLANLVHGRDVIPEMNGKVDALSISMNAQDEATYIQHCRPKIEGAYDAMLAFIRRAGEVLPEVTVTAIDGLAGVNIAACQKLAESLGVSFRRRTLDVVG